MTAEYHLVIWIYLAFKSSNCQLANNTQSQKKTTATDTCRINYPRLLHMRLHRKMSSLHAKCFAAGSQKAHEMPVILCASQNGSPMGPWTVAAFADNRTAVGATRNKHSVTRKKIRPVAKVIVIIVARPGHSFIKYVRL